MKRLFFILLPCIFCMIADSEYAFGQRVYEEDTIRLTREPIPSPVYYSVSGYTTVFNAPDLLAAKSLQPMLDRYAVLSGEKDSVFISELITGQEDPQRFHTIVVLEKAMNAHYRSGHIQLFDARGKQLGSILRFREEKVPAAGTNYFYAVGEKDLRAFEYFSVSMGCPAF